MQRAVVLFSGGLDSTTVLAIAKEQCAELFALTVDYGQRHQAELAAAKKILQTQGIAHKQVSVDLSAFGGSALTADIEVPTTTEIGIPITYVPARNTVFLSLALAWAEVLDADAIYLGINAVDYSGYPDCRPEFIEAYANMANVATKRGVEGDKISFQAPLLNDSKADIIRRGTALGVDYAQTVSCYQADELGRACAQCDACRFRAKGFEEAGIADPTRYVG